MFDELLYYPIFSSVSKKTLLLVFVIAFNILFIVYST